MPHRGINRDSEHSAVKSLSSFGALNRCREDRAGFMKLRPCIDIHDGAVKQIVGDTIGGSVNPRTGGMRAGVTENFVSFNNADYYARIYRKKNLPGGHIILLNSKETEPLRYEADKMQALGALAAYPQGMQIGGGINPDNAADFLNAGASHVIVTSYVFRDGKLDTKALRRIQNAAGREKLVLDLSCKRNENGDYVVFTDRWQKPTELVISDGTLTQLSSECDEFLIHAADVEGRKAGIEEPLSKLLGSWLQKMRRQGSGFEVTYAGGVHSLDDVRKLKEASGGELDFTVGSALDLFGGSLSLDELVQTSQ